MKFRFLPALMVVCAIPLTLNAQTENPFKKVKVGDYVEYKMTTKIGELSVEGGMKMSITEKDDKKAKMKVVAIVNGMEFPAGEQEVDLSKPYDPNQAGPGAPKGQDIKIEKVKEGKEKIKVGGKEYDCTFTKNKMTGKVNGVDFDGETTVWIAKDAPLSGMVKMEMKSKMADVTMELTGSGSSEKK